MKVVKMDFLIPTVMGWLDSVGFEKNVEEITVGEVKDLIGDIEMSFKISRSGVPPIRGGMEVYDRPPSDGFVDGDTDDGGGGVLRGEREKVV